MVRAWSSRFRTGLLLVCVLWQAVSCCCLGGAVTPPMTPAPISRDLARRLKDRLADLDQERGSFEVEIGDQELTSYIVGLLQSGAGEFPARDMQIRFNDGYVEMWATFTDIAPADIPTYVRLTVEAVDGDVGLHILQANAGPFPVPGAMRESISQSLSESLAEYDLALHIDRIEVQTGSMLIAGQVTGPLPDVP